MRFVNENTDDTFRRAGKDYPLNTGGSDWSKIASALGHPNGISEAEKNKNRRKYLWLLLLLPFSLVCNRYFENMPGNAEDEISATPYAGSNPLAKALRSFPKPALKRAKTLPVKNEEILAARSLADSSEHIFSSTQHNDKSSADDLNSGFKKEEQTAQQTTKREALNTLMAQKTITLSENEILSRNNVGDIIAKEKPRSRFKKISLGIEAGTGTTTVNFQKTKALGFDLGIVLGYALSKRLSVHAAVLSSQKNYYTDGKTFNASKIYLSPNTKIASVDGTCRMIEIPLALRYNFSASKKGEWFVAAGASSFLMKREDYDYEYFYANSGQSAKRSKTYKNSSKDWLAAAQFSGGYSYDVKGKFQFEAEPYVQLPLKGAGFGKLPLTSAGFRLSLVKKLF